MCQQLVARGFAGNEGGRAAGGAQANNAEQGKNGHRSQGDGLEEIAEQVGPLHAVDYEAGGRDRAILRKTSKGVTAVFLCDYLKQHFGSKVF